MSFRDFDPSVRRQPKQKHQEDGCYEKQIKTLIEKLQDENRNIKEELARSRSNSRKRTILEEFIVVTHDIARNTETLFRDWQVFLAGEPHERHRKKFSIEKLRRAFDDEVRHLKDLAATTLLLQEEQINQPRAKELEIRTMCNDDMEDPDEESGLLSSQMESQMLEERVMGIRRIQGQMSDVNQIFKDLASIVQDQGEVLDSIESEACAGADHARKGAMEIKKSHDRQKASRERVCCLLMVVCLFFTALVISHHGWSRPVMPFLYTTKVSAPSSRLPIDDGMFAHHRVVHRGVRRLREIDAPSFAPSALLRRLHPDAKGGT